MVYVAFLVYGTVYTGGMTRSQLGFFNIVGAPIFMAVIELFEDAQPMMQGLQANYHHWESGKIAELTI